MKGRAVGGYRHAANYQVLEGRERGNGHRVRAYRGRDHTRDYTGDYGYRHQTQDYVFDAPNSVEINRAGPACAWLARRCCTADFDLPYPNARRNFQRRTIALETFP